MAARRGAAAVQGAAALAAAGLLRLPHGRRRRRAAGLGRRHRGGRRGVRRRPDPRDALLPQGVRGRLGAGRPARAAGSARPVAPTAAPRTQGSTRDRADDAERAGRTPDLSPEVSGLRGDTPTESRRTSRPRTRRSPCPRRPAEYGVYEREEDVFAGQDAVPGTAGLPAQPGYQEPRPVYQEQQGGYGQQQEAYAAYSDPYSGYGAGRAAAGRGRLRRRHTATGATPGTARTPDTAGATRPARTPPTRRSCNDPYVAAGYSGQGYDQQAGYLGQGYDQQAGYAQSGYPQGGYDDGSGYGGLPPPTAVGIRPGLLRRHSPGTTSAWPNRPRPPRASGSRSPARATTRTRHQSAQGYYPYRDGYGYYTDQRGGY